MASDMEALGRRAVAYTAFRWMEGMRDAESDCVCVGASETDGVWVYRWAASNGYISEWRSLDGGEYPDFSDPATLGCLLALVREEWGDENAFIDPRGGWHMCVSSKGPEHGYDLEFWGDTEAEALVAALEAADGD